MTDDTPIRERLTPEQVAAIDAWTRANKRARDAYEERQVQQERTWRRQNHNG